MKRQCGAVEKCKTAKHRPNDEYWVLKGPRRDCFVCANFGEDEHAALCLFDSKGAAEEYLRCLSELQMFLNTLEQYGPFTPSWVRQETLLPKVCGISRRGLWKAIKDIGVGYVAINPPPEGVEEEIFELYPSGIFEAE